MGFQHLRDFVDIALCLGVFRPHAGQAVGGLAEFAEKALVFLLTEALELRHNIRKHFADLAQILCADIVQCGLRKVCHFFLCARAELQDHLRIAQINLLGKGLNLL